MLKRCLWNHYNLQLQITYTLGTLEHFELTPRIVFHLICNQFACTDMFCEIAPPTNNEPWGVYSCSEKFLLWNSMLSTPWNRKRLQARKYIYYVWELVSMCRQTCFISMKCAKFGVKIFNGPWGSTRPGKKKFTKHNCKWKFWNFRLQVWVF